jgi:hypothetical protein
MLSTDMSATDTSAAPAHADEESAAECAEQDTSATPDPQIWNYPLMRAALRRHDFTTVYRLLVLEFGYSQNRIGRFTDQSQPEVSAIIHGRRVISYSVIARITDGLGIPRAHVGISWCTCTTPATGQGSAQ